MGHTKGYVQVLVVSPNCTLGTSAMVKITSVGRWSVFGEIVKFLNQDINMVSSKKEKSIKEKSSPCCKDGKTCSCAKEPQSCGCASENSSSRSATWQEDGSHQNTIRWLWRRKSHAEKRVAKGAAFGSKVNQDRAGGRVRDWGLVDGVLLGGMLVSCLTILALFLHFGFRNLS